MNEWVRRLRSSVQAAVGRKRRKSADPSTTGERKQKPADATPVQTRSEPELELPPVAPPQLPGLTKQRARGPPRRRPSPAQQRTVSCPPVEADSTSFAWGRDPTIDPALFFSDVVGRSLGARGAGRPLTSIAERAGRTGPPSGPASDRSSRLSEASQGGPGASDRFSRLSEASQGGPGASDRSSRLSEASRSGLEGSEDGAGTRAGEAGARQEQSERLPAAPVAGDGELVQDGVPAECGIDGTDGTEQTEDGGSAGTGQSADQTQTRTDQSAGDGRQSPVLRLTGGEVEGTPRRRLCALL